MSAETSTPLLDLVVNGEPRRMAAGASIADLVRSLELNPQKVAVERNGEIAPRSTLAALVRQFGKPQLEVREGDMRKALSEIDKLDVVKAGARVIRIAG